MHYEELAPSPALAPLVRCFWRLRATGRHGGVSAAGPSASPDDPPGDPPGDPALPDGSPELIFSQGDPFEHVAPDGTVTLQPAAFLVGQITAPMRVRPTGDIDLFAVRFESHGASILHPALHTLTDRWIDVPSLGAPPLDRLAVALGQSTHPAHRVQLAEAALRDLAARSPRPDARVAAAVRSIRESDGTAPLDALAQSLGIAPRTLQRLFAAQVGITPKMLARIVRFQRVFAAWRADPRSLARVAVECGYFDQSHLVRDFRDFAGAPPAGFLAALPPFTGFFLD